MKSARSRDCDRADQAEWHELKATHFLKRLAAQGCAPFTLKIMVATSPFLVPPARCTEFGARLTPIWDEAVSALRTATNVIILSYSIPPTDQHFKCLLAAGLQNNISLRKVFFVNPAPGQQETEAQKELKRQLEDRLFDLFRGELFDQGLIETVPTDLRGFFTALSAGGGEPYRAAVESIRLHLRRRILDFCGSVRGEPLDCIACL